MLEIPAAEKQGVTVQYLCEEVRKEGGRECIRIS